jgi:CheY-like chemotaxis protein
MNPNRQTILLVDDDADDLQMLEEAFQEIGSPFGIIKAYNGMEALERLSELHRSGALPSLIVLDINMPRMDGKKTIVAIKQDQRLSSIPVVVFTTSFNPADKLYFSVFDVELITKPAGVEAATAAAARLLSYCE